MPTRSNPFRTLSAACAMGLVVACRLLGDETMLDALTTALLLESPDWSTEVVAQTGSPDSAENTFLAPPQRPDGLAPSASLPPPGADNEGDLRRGVRPYGGGSPGDWSWGCGGSPYHTGPGLCDDWKVGCRWHVAVDGIVMSREDAALLALTSVTDVDSAGNQLVDPLQEQFDYGPGGRVVFMSQVPSYVGYQLQVAYEGVEEWNASVVYPKASPMPGSADPDTSEQRALHYRSSLHSAEINFVRWWNQMLQPYCGVRYIKFDDEINDFINQQAPLGTVANDRLNLFDLENQLIGFQIGSGFQLLQLGERFALEGFFNAGVYHNEIKRTNLMGVFTTAADGTTTSVLNNDVSELSEIAYVSESSVTAVCRLNQCWALRAGYQMLWIGNLHLAEDAFLDTGDDAENLFFYGWHAGIECRR